MLLHSVGSSPSISMMMMMIMMIKNLMWTTTTKTFERKKTALHTHSPSGCKRKDWVLLVDSVS